MKYSTGSQSHSRHARKIPMTFCDSVLPPWSFRSLYYRLLRETAVKMTTKFYTILFITSIPFRNLR